MLPSFQASFINFAYRGGKGVRKDEMSLTGSC